MELIIDNEVLILEISKHEALFNTDCDYYRDTVHKQMTWMQVCQAVVENGTSLGSWEKMTQEEKAGCCKKVQQRWKGLKSAFIRTVRAPKRKVNSKEYYYAKQMSFLLPFAKCIQTSENTKDNEEKEQTLQPTSGTESNSSREEINIPFGEIKNEPADLLEIELREGPEDGNLATHGTQPHFGNSNACVEYQQFVQPNFSKEREVMYLPSSKRQKVSENLAERKSLSVFDIQKQSNYTEREVMCLPSSKRKKASENISERKSLNIFESQKQSNHTVQPCLQGARSVEVHGNNSSTSIQSEYESDKLFLMSLLPTITKLNEFDKLDFKGRVIQLLKSFARGSS